MVCGIIGHQYVEEDEIESRVYSTLLQLIDGNGVDTFILGSNSQFNDICFNLLKYIQEEGRKIKIINFACHGESPCGYDKAYAVKGTEGKSRFVKRNKAIINSSDIVLLYYNKNYRPKNRNSGTKIMYDYCLEKGKFAVNLFEQLI